MFLLKTQTKQICIVLIGTAMIFCTSTLVHAQESLVIHGDKVLV